MAETLRKVKSYENKSLGNIVDFAAYISGLDIKDIYAEFPSILSEFGYTLDEEETR